MNIDVQHHAGRRRRPSPRAGRSAPTCPRRCRAKTIEASCGRRARALGHQHAALACARAHRCCEAAPERATSAPPSTTPTSAPSHSEEYAYYPQQWAAPYIDRRRKVGWDLYGCWASARPTRRACTSSTRRNYAFFGAPVGLIFTIDRVMQQGSWLDYGMFLQNVMVAARARGLDTCPQAAFTQFHRIIAAHLAVARRRDGGVRHVAGPRRPGGGGEHAGHRARAGAGFVRFHDEG
jgi:nitroreductase